MISCIGNFAESKEKKKREEKIIQNLSRCASGLYYKIILILRRNNSETMANFALLPNKNSRVEET